MAKNMFIAKASSVIELKGFHTDEKTSNPIGIFLVEPIYQNENGKDKIICFRETITKNILIKRAYIEYGVTSKKENRVVDIDVKSSLMPVVGDLSWEVNDRYDARKVLGEDYVNAYLSKSAKYIEDKLNDTRAKAKELCTLTSTNKLVK